MCIEINTKMQTISTNNLFYNKETRCFSQEISALSKHLVINENSIIQVLSAKTGNSEVFTFTHKDMDASHEDIYGWNFVSNSGIKLLIVND